MEYIKKIMECLDGIQALCTEIDVTWKTVLGGETAAELDDEGAFGASVNTVVSKCEDTCNQLAFTCDIPRAGVQPAPEVNLQEYHTREFFQEQVYDADGNVVDAEAVYCDTYKVHKMLARLLLTGADQILTLARAIVEAYQYGADGWQAEITDLVGDTVQPVLDGVSELSDVLVYIGNWHTSEADRNISSFLAE